MSKQDAPHLWDAVWRNALDNPDRVIVKDANRHWTWSELIVTASRYADAINGVPGLPRESIIPVFVDRGGHTVAAIVGIILTGRAYAPVSLDQPHARIEECFRLLDARICVETSREAGQAFMGVRSIPRPRLPASGELPALVPSSSPGEMIYVLFTSGSTGQPKGVLVSQGNILNTMLWSRDILDWHRHDVIGCATNFFFDISQFDLLTALYFDIPLAIYSRPDDANGVVAETGLFGVTSIFSVPAFFSQLLRGQGHMDRRMRSLRRIISGGDFFPPQHVIRWLDDRPDVAIFNAWGPTETSIVNTMYRVTDTDRRLLQDGHFASVGRAHSRMPFVLLDESDREVTEPGVRGEICMLGSCVTRGYLKNPEESRQAFFLWQGQPAFRTKDIGWLDKDQFLFILGRKGSTVKISGYRVDLGEVEQASTSEPGVHLARAFVVDLQDGVKELWVAVEPCQGIAAFDIYQFKKGLRQRLPRYMVPKRVLTYDALPKNANGKIDRRLLAEMAQRELETA